MDFDPNEKQKQIISSNMSANESGQEGDFDEDLKIRMQQVSTVNNSMYNMMNISGTVKETNDDDNLADTLDNRSTKMVMSSKKKKEQALKLSHGLIDHKRSSQTIGMSRSPIQIDDQGQNLNNQIAEYDSEEETKGPQPR